MKFSRRVLAMLLSVVAITQFARPAHACGPESLDPLFVFRNSPDPPFREFTQGKIGILKPTFGRKTLTIAYRILNGGVFSGEEQQALVEALKGRAPEEDNEEVIKAWIAARKTILEHEEELPAIYTNRNHSGYDFFPNCTSNAFEVATETLKDRVSRFGSQSVDVRDWLEGQDVVFRNCAEGSLTPKLIGAERSQWLRKDREYQTAAALFYSLNLDEARQRFAQIAQDNESDWQETADYLVARTLVRQGSLESNETAKRALYESAETYLHNLLPRANRFRLGSKKLLALVKYRLRPEERVRELAQTLTVHSGNDNLRQDLIDYTWLLDKFDQQIQVTEAERQKQLTPQKPDVASGEAANADNTNRNLEESLRTYDAVQRGEVIQIWLYPKKPNGEMDYSAGGSYVFPPNASAADILQAVEGRFGRKLTPEESKALSEGHVQALETRKFWLSPNRKMRYGGGYDGCSYNCNDINLDQIPNFLKADDLSDWIFTFQSDDPRAYGYALEKWRESQSPAWLVAALAKASKTSPSLGRLLSQSEMIQPDTPVFTTIAYHRIRLYIELARHTEARRLLDDLITTRFESLPVSAQNQVVQMRMELATDLSEFLKFSTRQPVAFYESGVMGSLGDILKAQREMSDLTDTEGQARFEQLMAWDKRVLFDLDTVEVLNRHFPTTQLLEVAHNSAIPDYLRTRVLLTVWTRAVLLRDDELARKTTAEIVAKFPDNLPLFQKFLRAATPTERDDTVTFILLKWPQLSPFIAYGIEEVGQPAEATDYYFELSWWCATSETDYDEQGNEIPRVVKSPSFFTADTLAMASRERKALIAIGDAKKYLGRRVLDWAKRKPKDARLPEALFIAAKANEGYKYGCGGWEQDEELRLELERILTDRYAGSSWAAKLKERDQ